MKILSCFLIVFYALILPIYSQTNTKYYIESISEVQGYLMNNDYNESLFVLKKLEKEGYNNANMNYLIGICCLNSLTEKRSSVEYLKKASNSISSTYNEENPEEINAPSEALLFLGDAYLVNNKIKEARSSYIRYMNQPNIPESKKDIARSRLRNCLFARLQMDKPLKIKLENAGSLINSGIANSNPCISSDGKTMVYLHSMKFYDALFYAFKSDTGWLEPVNITTQVGSDGEFIPTGLSPDGSKLLLKSFNDPNGYEIYESTFNGKKWTKMKKLEAPVNSKYQDIDASYDSDGTSIYFSSNRIGGTGGYDIYKATLDPVSHTYNVSNMGPIINSYGNEKVPSVIDNGNLLIFSTDFRNSIGGYDFYYSQKMDNQTWSEPIDIGYPINTTSNDLDLHFTNTLPRMGVLSKNDIDGYTANDIFSFRCPVFSTLKLIPLSGKVKISDSSYNDISLAVVDVKEKDTAFILKPDESGNYNAELYPGDFNLIVKNKGKTELSSSFTIPNDYQKESYPLEVKIEKPEIKLMTKDTIQICDILFNFNDWNLSESESKLLLNIIIQLKKYDIKSIKLYGYTDAIGSEKYNLLLSEKRANNVKKYMEDQGISEITILTQGIGSNNFIAPNTKPGGWDYPEGRSYNRRVELSITFNSENVILIKKDRVPKVLRIK